MNHQLIENIKAISFDLDDTLYDNPPVIQKAYQTLYDYLVVNYPKIKNNYNFNTFLKHAAAFQEKNKSIVDLSTLRRQHILSLLTEVGVGKNDTFVEDAFDVFWNERQRVTLYPGVNNILQNLSTKRPLITISNGNACPKAIGIDSFFQFSVSTKDTSQPKPDPSMFLFACEKLAIKPQQLLHIGDSLNIDVNGAQRAGCRAVWFNTKKIISSTAAEFTIEDLNQLLLFDFI